MSTFLLIALVWAGVTIVVGGAFVVALGRAALSGIEKTWSR